MAGMKVMPPEEKYRFTLNSMRAAQSMIVDFVREYISEQAVDDLRAMWRKGIKPIPRDGTPEEQYEIAYRNWTWVGQCNFRFVRERLGEQGIADLMRTEVEHLKHVNDKASLRLLSLVRAVSPGLAFSMLARPMVDRLQWITPYTAAGRGREVVINMPRCKVLDYDGTEDICNLGCQKVYPKWVAEQFGVRMKFDPREDHSCTCTLTPLRKQHARG